ncbi:MAG: hypothetical protein H7061_01900 [Bdellovibrionaceae bacterium]|nr:hypothetical protein [Bdellovibrio sp.]
MKFIIYLTLGLGLSAQAEIRGVGKGGGYGEMQALSVNLNMENLTRACANSPALCHMSAKEAQDLMLIGGQMFDLKFDPTCTLTETKILSKYSAQISSCELYIQQVNPVVKTYSEIAQTVLSVRLMATLNYPQSLAMRLAKKTFKDTIQIEQNLSVNLTDGNFLFHVLSVEFFEQKKMYLSLEGQLQTIDATQLVEKAIGCALKYFEIQLQNITSLSDQSAIVSADLNGQCPQESKPWRGILQLYFETQTKEVTPASVKARIISKELM